MELYDVNGNKTVKADAFSTVPTDFQPFYKQDGDNYVLDEANPAIKSAVGIMGSLKGALTKARKDLTAANGKAVDLSALSEYGSTPAEIKAALDTKIATLTDSVKNGKLDTENIRKGVATEWQGKVTAATSRADKLMAQLDKTLVDGAAASAINTHKGKAKGLLPLIRQHVKTVVAEDGTYNVQVLGSDGQQRYNGSGSPMSIDELVAEMKTDKDLAGLFESESPSGGGARPGASQQRQNTPFKRDGENLTPAELIQRGLKNKQFVASTR